MTDETGALAYEPTPMVRLRWRIARARYVVVTRWRAACDWLKWLGHDPSNLERHAEHELRLAGWLDKDGLYGDLMGRSVLLMIREFADQGHSGMSAPAAIGLFEKVVRFEPLTPLTGADEEWNELDGGRFQNRRCSHVFKGPDGRAYDIEGRVFREPSGDCYTNRDSRVYVDFPYVPTTEYVDVPDPKERRDEG